MIPQAIEQITKLLPERMHTFTGSDYPLPIAQTFVGNEAVDLDRIRRVLRDRKDDDPKTVLCVAPDCGRAVRGGLGGQGGVLPQ